MGTNAERFPLDILRDFRRENPDGYILPNIYHFEGKIVMNVISSNGDILFSVSEEPSKENANILMEYFNLMKQQARI